MSGNRQTSNVTVEQDNLEIYIRLKNKTTHAITKREKRNAINEELFDDRKFNKAKDVIMKYNTICKENNQDEICKDLVEKLKFVIDDEQKENNFRKDTQDIKNLQDSFSKTPKEVTKRETKRIVLGRNTKQASTPSIELQRKSFKGNAFDDLATAIFPQHYAHYHKVVPPPLTDPCLIARLIKQEHTPSYGG